MVGGLGYMAGKAGAKRAERESSQEQRIENVEAGQAQPAGGAQAGAPAPSTLDQLKQLGELRDSGVLTPEEFENEKQKIMSGGVGR